MQLLLKTFLFILLTCCCASAQSILVTSGDTWKYLDNGSDQGTAWRNVGFNDALWASGNSELGYGEGDETTVVSYGGNPDTKHITTYFRKVVTLSSTYNSFILRGKRDDGVAIYFNGVQIFKDGLNEPILYNTLATNAADDGQVWLNATLPGNILQVGQNTIAVEIHQTAINSSDITFDFELIGQNSTYISRGPYLQMGTTNSMQVRYRTNVATSSKINYGTDPSNLNSQVSDNIDKTEHVVDLINLIPNTKYYYNVANSTEVIQSSAQHYFYTAPTVGTEKKTKVWVTGDCGTGTSTQANVKNAFLNYVGNSYIDLWLLLGDNAYSSGHDYEYQSLFFEPYQNSRTMKQTPIFPAPGNHDYYSSSQASRSGAYFQNFTLPTNGEIGGPPSYNEGYYSYNYANIHFISLDSYGTETASLYRLSDTLNSPQIAWLKADLAANTQKWTIVYWHHPPYTMGSHNSDTELELRYIREKVLPILERNNVDLVLCGHSHNYERTRLIKGHYGLETTFSANTHNQSSSSGRYDGTADSCPYVKSSALPNKGIVYVVSGSAGWVSGIQGSYPHDATVYSNSATGGSIYLEIEGNRLDSKWISENGTVADQFTIMKDVNKNTEVVITPNTPSLSLQASWLGDYAWNGYSNTAKTLTINPVIGQSYFVEDSRQCLRDTFTIKVNPNCVNNYQMTNEIGGNSLIKFEASQTISASNKLQNGTGVTYNAGNSILLSNGFQANSGAVFKAEIKSCEN
ncbi:metallophosphoesterase family protein [Lacihabitans sp. CCS-44]|uniref:purple acid phosphatase family protein n=1 Tax=Lacihabitans sp. CCS-44 TaxID=2487331 RepID=UPI0020CD8BA0|nr:metallophosphoesterase family protein [Lacihabitans sp. CCS-44]MCP9756688.1 metallophosphoesterase family protein [Lacihabitans sp. CCS-44]